ncbi:MAG TPA: methyltransferase domain-containing protein [Gammaproteobacteria bacterium]|nr:methyltransferase domain-containing protein [Gammaproteobacteria bacterium]
MPHGMYASEFFYYKNKTFKNITPVTELDLSLINSRKVECKFERHHYYPADYFFFNYTGGTFCGRKILSELFLTGKQSYKKCNQLTAPMIIGLVSRTQILEKGILIFYKPLENPEKAFLFNQLKQNPLIDLYFPFPVFNKELKEYVQTVEAWDPSETMADGLNAGEQHLRNYTMKFLSQFDLKGKKIYDPACSTGKFLESIKQTYPESITIGQDINPEMIKFAKRHSKVDEFHVGNALYPAVENESVDFVFLRFLNSSVVSSEYALKLFCNIAQSCKINGIMVVFGFTPVLLSAEIFQMLNLEVRQTIAYNEENDSIFQYYVLKKTTPVPQLKYESFSTLNLSQQQFLAMGKNITPAQSDIDQQVVFRSKL